jgi:hypothetical protein
MKKTLLLLLVVGVLLVGTFSINPTDLSKGETVTGPTWKFPTPAGGNDGPGGGSGGLPG